MPQPGETVTEAVITGWLKSVGDQVGAGDVLFEIDTDKSAMEVTATAAGTLTEIYINAGESALVNTVVACVAVQGETITASSSSTGNPMHSLVPAAALPTVSEAAPPALPSLEPYNFVRTPERHFGPATLPNGMKITPLARRLATEMGVNLSEITGSGPRGRIVAADIKANSAPQPDPSSIAVAATGATREAVMAQYADTEFKVIELDGMRRTVARRLTESKQTVPHFYLSAEIGLEKLLALRQKVNASLTAKLSINDFVVKAFALALQREPAANAVWAEDRILTFAQSDVGVAISVENGLFTPIVRSADTKSLSVISAEIKDFAARARDRKLKPEEYRGGSASVSNLGMYGIQNFHAIINPPHATILAVGAGERRPVESTDGGIQFDSKMTVTLSVDHRVIDGTLGAQLLAAFKANIENPLAMLV